MQSVGLHLFSDITSSRSSGVETRVETSDTASGRHSHNKPVVSAVEPVIHRDWNACSMRTGILRRAVTRPQGLVYIIASKGERLQVFVDPSGPSEGERLQVFVDPSGPSEGERLQVFVDPSGPSKGESLQVFVDLTGPERPGQRASVSESRVSLRLSGSSEVAE